ncbi:S-layer family protein [Moorena producens JHB]|uniref:S-layer family protein n=1 Tax=Moorena producens (strain JHB) TaxID=1454205 RepID=A0A9Q9UWD6_MOOP1|nr:S-layer family protein [Moorena producens]WAN69785.1 S-layer family protein [Moorena producens JHB]
MKPRIDRLVAASPFVLCSLLAATTALGQITPDNTVGNERSVVTPNVDVNGNLADLIEGGAIRESNLFHSFQDFNVAEFGRVYFANPAGIENILSRVTGGNVSNILGTLGVLGNANLFLINPNGIVFGPNSILDIGGSFFGSTADSVLFEDGTVFSAKNPNGKPLLTINIPSGLQYGSNPGSITNQSSLFQVPNGQTLGLIGGDINIPGGNLTATDGRIELGSVGSNSVVNLTPKDTSFVLDYSGVQEFQDISLSERAIVITSGEGGGSIQVQGANVTLRDRSFVFASTNGSGSGGGIVVGASQLSLEGGSRITTDVFGSGQGGDLTVDATESVRVIGLSANGTVSALGARVLQGATGNSGNINIQTSSLVLDNGGRVDANTFGTGNGGIINISVSDQVFLQSGDFSSGGGFSGILNNVRSGAEGNTGGINITTGSLVVENAGQIQSDVSGQGNSGKITIRAKDTVSFDGRQQDRFPSAAFSRVQSGGIGNSGGINIITEGSLFITNRAQLSAVTSGTGNSGNIFIDAQDQVFLSNSIIISEISEGADQVTGDRKAGDITIKTGSLVLKDGSSLLADTEAQGNGGKITIEARDNVILEGIGPSAFANSTNLVSSQITSTIDNFEQAVGNGGDINISTKLLSLTDGAFIRNDNFNQGNAGNIKITTENLSLTDSAFLSVRNRGQGNPGNLGIEADSILLDNKGIITAETVGGDQGNITLSSRDIRLLNESNITTNAENTTGGNITIDTDTLLGLGNSDITANALEGPGGRVEINAQGIFGLEFRDRLTPENDITATSTLGPSFSGEVILNTPDVDPTSGLTELPASPVDAEAILANDLCGFENNRIAGGSSFIITGKGGLPASADDSVINTDRTVGWLSRPRLASSSRKQSLQQLQQQPSVTQPQPPQEKKVIIEAQGWVRAKDGTIILTAQPFRGTPVDQILPHLDCHSGGGRREIGR